MNVEANDLACVFGPCGESGMIGRVLWPHDVSEVFGQRWVVRFKTIGECIVADAYMMHLSVDPRQDPDARELLDRAGQVAWDLWSAPPEVDL